jgi:hypothetical protein
MSWGRLDDSLHRHRKIRKLRQDNRPQVFNAALTLWTLANSQCCDDGRPVVSLADACELLGQDKRSVQRAIEALVDAGLWDPCGDVWMFHDWDDYRPARDREANETVTADSSGRRCQDEARTEDGGTGSKDARAPYKDRARIPTRPDQEKQNKAEHPVTAFEAVERTFSAMRKAKVNVGFRAQFSDYRVIEGIVAMCDLEGAPWGEDPDAFMVPLRAALGVFFADDKCKAQGYPFQWLKEPGSYLARARMAKAATGPDADLAAKQADAQAKLDEAISQTRQDEIERWRAEVMRIAEERRKQRGHRAA